MQFNGFMGLKVSEMESQSSLLNAKHNFDFKVFTETTYFLDCTEKYPKII